ncbi:MAG: flagellar hook-length control protein FliK [Gammaproteobacteria bacterium]|nr:flagellar hook-length control protein FliK [Gammaproteobacteria bacterium]
MNANGRLFLRVGRDILETKTPIALKAGDQLKLLVKSLGETTVLKILTTDDSPNAAAQSLKGFIARQQDLAQLLQLNRNIFDNSLVPKILKQQLIELNQILPTAEQATQAKTLKKIIQNSGVFLESRLYRQQTEQYNALTLDIKSQLLKISAQLQNIVPELTAKPQLTTLNNIQSETGTLVQQFIKAELNPVQFTALLTNQLSNKQIELILQALNLSEITLLPKELLASFTPLLNHIQQHARPRQLLDNLSSLLKTMGLLQELKTDVDGALAKITSQQLTTLTREADSLLYLLCDLIIKDEDENHLIQLRLQQENSTKEQNDSNWSVTLNFNFKELGPVEARLHLTGNDISTVFRAERETTADNISNQIELLDTAFRNIGFDSINLDITQGSITQPRDLPENVHILDEIA